MIVICDSTVIIGLAKIGKLELLKQIYGEVYIPDAVFIIDDERARTSAISAGFQVIGLIGVLLLAKHLRLIPLIKPLLGEKNKEVVPVKGVKVGIFIVLALACCVGVIYDIITIFLQTKFPGCIYTIGARLAGTEFSDRLIIVRIALFMDLFILSGCAIMLFAKAEEAAHDGE